MLIFTLDSTKRGMILDTSDSTASYDKCEPKREKNLNWSDFHCWIDVNFIEGVVLK